MEDLASEEDDEGDELEVDVERFRIVDGDLEAFKAAPEQYVVGLATDAGITVNDVLLPPAGRPEGIRHPDGDPHPQASVNEVSDPDLPRGMPRRRVRSERAAVARGARPLGDLACMHAGGGAVKADQAKRPTHAAVRRPRHRPNARVNGRVH